MRLSSQRNESCERLAGLFHGEQPSGLCCAGWLHRRHRGHVTFRPFLGWLFLWRIVRVPPGLSASRLSLLLLLLLRLWLLLLLLLLLLLMLLLQQQRLRLGLGRRNGGSRRLWWIVGVPAWLPGSPLLLLLLFLRRLQLRVWLGKEVRDKGSWSNRRLRWIVGIPAWLSGSLLLLL